MPKLPRPILRSCWRTFIAAHIPMLLTRRDIQEAACELELVWRIGFGVAVNSTAPPAELKALSQPTKKDVFVVGLLSFHSIEPLLLLLSSFIIDTILASHTCCCNEASELALLALDFTSPFTASDQTSSRHCMDTQQSMVQSINVLVLLSSNFHIFYMLYNSRGFVIINSLHCSSVSQ